MKFSIRLALFFIACLTFNEISGQYDFHLRGTLDDADTQEKLKNCEITVYQNGRKSSTTFTGDLGTYELHLALDFKYEIKFAKPEYVSKIILIDLRNLTEEEKEGGFQMDLPGTLFKYQKGFNKRILEEPIGKIAMSSETRLMEWDENYFYQMKAKVYTEFARLKAIQDVKYKNVISKADSAMQAKKWKTAKKYYSKALKIKPEESLPKEKILEIERILEEEKK